MKQIMTAATISQPLTPDTELPKLKAKPRRGTQTAVTSASVSAPQIRPSKVIIYETPKREPVREDNVHDDDYDDEFLEEDAKRLGRENLGPVAGLYLVPYLYKSRFHDTQYGTRKDGDTFKIGDSKLLVHQDGDITIKKNEFRGSEWLWDILTCKNVNKEHVISDDLGKYNKILLLTNAHLEGSHPGGVINVGRGKMFREIIARLFAKPKRREVESELRRA